MAWTKKAGIAAASILTVGLIGTGAAVANANPTASPSSSPSVAASAGTDQASGQQTAGTDRGGRQGNQGDHQRPADLTGDVLAQVTDAVKAKDANATIDHAWQDADGSGYDAMATSNGTTVKYEISTDFKTVTVETAPAGGQGGHGHRGGQGDQQGQQSQSQQAGGQQGGTGQQGDPSAAPSAAPTQPA